MRTLVAVLGVTSFFIVLGVSIALMGHMPAPAAHLLKAAGLIAAALFTVAVVLAQFVFADDIPYR